MKNISDILQDATWLERVEFLIEETKRSSARGLYDEQRIVFQLGMAMLSMITGGNISLQLLNRVREKGVNNGNRSRMAQRERYGEVHRLPSPPAAGMYSPSTVSSISDIDCANSVSVFGYSPNRRANPSVPRELRYDDSSGSREIGSTVIVGGTKEYLDSLVLEECPLALEALTYQCCDRDATNRPPLELLQGELMKISHDLRSEGQSSRVPSMVGDADNSMSGSESRSIQDSDITSMSSPSRSLEDLSAIARVLPWRGELQRIAEDSQELSRRHFNNVLGAIRETKSALPSPAASESQSASASAVGGGGGGGGRHSRESASSGASQSMGQASTDDDSPFVYFHRTPLPLGSMQQPTSNIPAAVSPGDGGGDGDGVVDVYLSAPSGSNTDTDSSLQDVPQDHKNSSSNGANTTTSTTGGEMDAYMPQSSPLPGRRASAAPTTQSPSMNAPPRFHHRPPSRRTAALPSQAASSKGHPAGMGPRHTHTSSQHSSVSAGQPVAPAGRKSVGDSSSSSSSTTGAVVATAPMGRLQINAGHLADRLLPPKLIRGAPQPPQWVPVKPAAAEAICSPDPRATILPVSAASQGGATSLDPPVPRICKPRLGRGLSRPVVVVPVEPEEVHAPVVMPEPRPDQEQQQQVAVMELSPPELTALLGRLEALNEEVGALLQMAEECEKEHGLDRPLPSPLPSPLPLPSAAAAAAAVVRVPSNRHQDNIPPPSPPVPVSASEGQGMSPTPPAGKEPREAPLQPVSSPFKGATASVLPPMDLQEGDHITTGDAVRSRLSFDSAPATPLSQPLAGPTKGSTKGPAGTTWSRGRPPVQTVEIALSGGAKDESNAKINGSPRRTRAAHSPRGSSFRFGTSYSLSPQRGHTR